MRTMFGVLDGAAKVLLAARQIAASKTICGMRTTQRMTLPLLETYGLQTGFHYTDLLLSARIYVSGRSRIRACSGRTDLLPRAEFGPRLRSAVLQNAARPVELRMLLEELVG